MPVLLSKPHTPLSHLLLPTPIMAFLAAPSTTLSLSLKSQNSATLHSHRFDSTLVRCQQNPDTPTPSRGLSLDRRGVLLGLSGLYGAVTTAAPPSLAQSMAEHSDHSTHHHTHNHPVKITKEAIDYVLPSSSAPKRVRRPAHLVDAAYVAQFEEGLQKMKDLPADHPWNLDNHAAAHPPGVHDGWLFLPWHRLYIHFFERAIGHLTGDDTFALPYWNFDSPDGMSIPSLFTSNPKSPLYNPSRDPAHLPPALIDLRYAYTSSDRTALSRDEQVRDNLWQIGMAFRQSLTLGPLWAGGPAKEGVPFYGGRFENLHKPIHQWVGLREVPFSDMGNPHTTSRDPMFYSLHANVDRLWDIYRGFRGNRDDFADTEWHNIPFTFYDETGQLVRVKVGDALNSSKLGYTYEQVPLLWAGKLPSNPDINTWGNKTTAVSFTPLSEFGSEPRLIDASLPPVRVMVTRAKAPLTKHDKEEHVEVLHVKGVDVIPGQPTRFDVFVSTPSKGGFAGPGYGVYAGNFIKPHVVHAHNHATAAEKAKAPKKKEKGGLKLGLAPVLDALGADGAEKLVVTFVPRDGKVVVDGVGVELLKTDGSLMI